MLFKVVYVVLVDARCLFKVWNDCCTDELNATPWPTNLSGAQLLIFLIRLAFLERAGVVEVGTHRMHILPVIGLCRNSGRAGTDYLFRSDLRQFEPRLDAREGLGNTEWMSYPMEAGSYPADINELANRLSISLKDCMVSG